MIYSLTYLFFIILSPVGAYHPQGFNPLKIHVEDQFTRSAIGGTGYIKASGNYAGSILAAHKAHAHHCSQVLWLDAHDRKYAEEAGAMNIFFVMGDEIITPPLTGTILPGITRQSVIQLLKDWDQKIIERQISIDEIISGILNMMYAGASYQVIRDSVIPHPTVSELIPTMLEGLKEI